ncbi:MAG: hypothetical protein EOP06_21705 [Proteobacteria bacterium]|nr:MAG: hypothetical protein EOP06_21705 [Pseudomonadota bacterium]
MIHFLAGFVLLSAVSGATGTSSQPSVIEACKTECPKAKRPHELHLCLRRLEEKPDTKASISESCRLKFEAYEEHKTSGHFGKKK